jgi:hypothetical protein
VPKNFKVQPNLIVSGLRLQSGSVLFILHKKIIHPKNRKEKKKLKRKIMHNVHKFKVKTHQKNNEGQPQKIQHEDQKKRNYHPD